MTGLTYDTGALIAAERQQQRFWELHTRTMRRRARVTIPAAVLTEAWRGQVMLARLLRGCVVEPLDEQRAREAGLLLAGCSLDVGAVDATVVEGALRRGDAVVSGNRARLEALACGQPLAIIDV